MTRCKCGHLSDAHKISNGVCIWRGCNCMGFDPDSETGSETDEGCRTCGSLSRDICTDPWHDA